MSDSRQPSPSSAPAPGGAARDPRPAYEPPRLVKKRAVRDVTLISGGVGPPVGPSPIVSNG